VSGAFVIYDYFSATTGFGGGGNSFRPGTILQTDKNGRFCIPSRVFFRVPLIDQGPPQLRIHAVWSPQVHNRAFLWMAPYGEVRVPGIMDSLPAQGKLAFHDLTAEPGNWASIRVSWGDLSRDGPGQREGEHL
jgi:hypothetical protein